MSNEFMFLPVALLNQQTKAEIMKCNEFTLNFGLYLNDSEVHELMESRKEALESSGRIEFGGGVISKIIMEFSDSPFLNQDSYADTLMELQEIFYYFKNESQEELTDNELIQLMKKYFDDVCQGSLEYLNTTMLENYCRDIRYGTNSYLDSDGYEDNYVDFMDYDREDFEF